MIFFGYMLVTPMFVSVLYVNYKNNYSNFVFDMKFQLAQKTKKRLYQKARVSKLLEKFHLAFNKIDVDRTGTLDLWEFRSLLKLAIPEKVIDDETFSRLFKHFDADKGGSISFDEFMQVLSDAHDRRYHMRNKGNLFDLLIQDITTGVLGKDQECCCGCFDFFIKYFYKLVTGAVWETLIYLVVIANSVTLSLRYYDWAYYPNGVETKYFKSLLDIEFMFTIFYSVEAFIKLLGMREKYFESALNLFDLAVVAIGWYDFYSTTESKFGLRLFLSTSSFCSACSFVTHLH